MTDDNTMTLADLGVTLGSGETIESLTALDEGSLRARCPKAYEAYQADIAGRPTLLEFRDWLGGRLRAATGVVRETRGGQSVQLPHRQ